MYHPLRAIMVSFLISAGQVCPAAHTGPLDGESIASALQEAMEPTDKNATNKFIVPNEFGNFLHYRSVPRVERISHTAVISVGTVRAFNLAGALRRDSLIALDFSNGVYEFNSIFADLIAANDRVAFLKIILGTPDQKDIGSRMGFLRAIKSGFERPTEHKPTNTKEAAFYQFLPHPNSSQGQSRWLGWLFAMRGYAFSPESWAATILGNDDAYNHVRKIILEGRFHCIRASLSGDKAMGKIGSILGSGGYVVSELDISNALEGIVSHEGDDGVKRFTNNLRRLPIDGASRVLVTIDQRFTSKDQIHGEAVDRDWVYISLNFHEIALAIIGVSSETELSSKLLKPTLIGRCLNGPFTPIEQPNQVNP